MHICVWLLLSIKVVPFVLCAAVSLSLSVAVWYSTTEHNMTVLLVAVAIHVHVLGVELLGPRAGVMRVLEGSHRAHKLRDCRLFINLPYFS